MLLENLLTLPTLMYPYLKLFGVDMHMTGVGILLFALTFLYFSKKYAKEQKLDRKSFSSNIPKYILIIYFLSSYTRYLISDFVILPTSIEQILLYISPYNYQFHLVGITLAAGICVYDFLGSQVNRTEHVKWIDSWFLSTMIALIPFGIFLLLGDNFIGSPTDGNFRVSAFDPNSKMAAYDTVLPIGLVLSLIGLVLFLSTKFYTLRHKDARGYGFFGRSIFLILLCILLLFQEYSRHVVFGFLGKTRDIKNYLLLISAGYILYQYQTTYSFFSKLPRT